MKSNILLSSVFAAATLFSASTFAAPATDNQAKLQSIYKSSNIKQGLINACVEEQNKLGAAKVLSKTEVTQLCKCNIESQGRMTNADQWELQSAQNAKDKNKYVALMQKFGKSEQPKVKACLGTALDTKLASMQKK